MKAQIFFFLTLVVGCTPGDPVIADYQGRLLEYGTEEPVDNADVKLLKPVFSGPTGSGSYETIWSGKTDHNGVFTTQWSNEMQLGYFVGDSSFFDLGPSQASWVEGDQSMQTFFLMGKSCLKLNIQDTGQINNIALVELFPFSPLQSSTVNVPLNSFPYYTTVFSNYPLSLSYRLHYTDGSQGAFSTLSFLTSSKGDTTQAVLYY
jgi:hypothetical protein